MYNIYIYIYTVLYINIYFLSASAALSQCASAEVIEVGVVRVGSASGMQLPVGRGDHKTTIPTTCTLISGTGSCICTT